MRNKKFESNYGKELKASKLPLKQEGDRIARYGKGFSNLLNIVGSPNFHEEGLRSIIKNERSINSTANQ